MKAFFFFFTFEFNYLIMLFTKTSTGSWKRTGTKLKPMEGTEIHTDNEKNPEFNSYSSAHVTGKMGTPVNFFNLSMDN